MAVGRSKRGRAKFSKNIPSSTGFGSGLVSFLYRLICCWPLGCASWLGPKLSRVEAVSHFSGLGALSGAFSAMSTWRRRPGGGIRDRTRRGRLVAGRRLN